jgi:endonuclease YncB( thermonuclease family)
MKLRPFLTPLVLLTATGGLLGWLLLVEPPEVPSGEKNASTIAGAPPSPPSSASATNTQAGDAPAVAAEPSGPIAAAPLPDEIRNVSPEGVSAPKVSGDLKRIEPSKRYLELKNPPAEALPDGEFELYRAQVPDGGHLKTDKLTVRLAYIVPLKPDETCISRLGGTWPCGARARTFLRGLIRQLKVTCVRLQVHGPEHLVATCTRGGFDLSKRMLRYGWADPSPDAPPEMLELAEAAKEKKIGKWQSEWLNELPASDWANSSPTSLPGLEELAPEIVDWSLPTDPSQLQDTPFTADQARESNSIIE